MTDGERDGYIEWYGRAVLPLFRGVALAGVPRG